MNGKLLKCVVPFQSVRVHFLERDSCNNEDKLIFIKKLVKAISFFDVFIKILK